MASVSAFSAGLEERTFTDCSPSINEALTLKSEVTSQLNRDGSVSTADEFSAVDDSSSSLSSSLSSRGCSDTEDEKCAVICDAIACDTHNADLGLGCKTSPAVTKTSLRPGAWVARHRAMPEADLEKTRRTVRSILNKLTLEKFEALYEQLAACGLSTAEHLVILMQEVFDKATSQHHFIEMYADLCMRLDADPRLVSGSCRQDEAGSFRHLLLSACQSAFLRLLEPAVSCADFCEEQEALRRKIALGNVKLVGHLLVRGMLSSKLLVACSESLLRRHAACPEGLEFAAALLTVTGRHFESRKEWEHADRLTALFGEIAKLTSDSKVSARSRFLLRDLLELREAGWPSEARPAVAKERPMLLEEVREKARSATWQAHSWTQHGSAGAVPRVLRTSRPTSQSEPTPGGLELSRLSASAAPFVPKGAAEHAAVAGVAAQRAARVHPRSSQKLNTHRAESSAAGHAASSHRKPPCASMAPVARANDAAFATAVSSDFNLKAFRKEITAILRDLSVHRNVALAVGRVRKQRVPLKYQACQFMDLLTRAAEDSSNERRQHFFAFVAGLAAGEASAFERAQCLKGIAMFFKDVFEDLREEVPKLSSIVNSGMLPTLQSVLGIQELKTVLPIEIARRLRPV